MNKAFHPEQAVYWRMTIRFAQLYEQMLHDWCDECINELEMMIVMVHTSFKFGRTLLTLKAMKVKVPVQKLWN